MNVKNIFLLLIVVSLLAVAGCGNNQELQTDKDFQTGSDGLELEILTMPRETYHEIPFSTSINLKNEGAYDVADAILLAYVGENDFCILDESNNCLTSVKQQFDIPGKSVFNPIGDYEIVDYQLRSKKLRKNQPDKTKPIVFKTCYTYQTKLQEDLCINTLQDSTSPLQAACETRDISTGDQGAPVAISGIRTTIHRYRDQHVRPEFIITVRNVGSGTVVAKDKIDEVCSNEDLEYRDWNALEFEEVKLSYWNKDFVYKKGGANTNSITCTPNAEKGVRLRDDSVEIRCMVNEPGIPKSEGAFVTQIALSFSYGYTSTVSESITVINPDIVK